MRINVRLTVRAALATYVAGAVVCFSGCERRSTAEEPVALKPKATNRVSTVRTPTNGHVRASTVPKRTPKKDVRAAKKTATLSKMLPDAVVRVLVDDAVNENDYKRLSVLLGKIDRISDPQIRLRLLEGLSWFEETAVEDAIPFLLDADTDVAARASEIVSSRISSIPKPEQREKVYTASLKLMPDSADRDILISTLENERKLSLLHVMRDMEAVRSTQPDLWQKLKAAYESACGRPYVSYVDALLHYDPRKD